MRSSAAAARRRATSSPSAGPPSSPFAARRGFSPSETASQESTASSEASKNSPVAKRISFSGAAKQVTATHRAQGNANTRMQSATACLVDQLKAQVANLSEEVEHFKSAEQSAQADAKEAEESNEVKHKTLRSKLAKAQKTAKAASEERDAEKCNSRIALAEVDAFRTEHIEAKQSLRDLYHSEMHSLETEIHKAKAERQLEQVGLVERLRAELAARSNSEAEQQAEAKAQANSQESALEVAAQDLELLRCNLKEARAYESTAFEQRNVASTLRQENEVAHANRKSLVESEQSAKQVWLQEAAVLRYEIDSARATALERDKLVGSLESSLSEVEVRCKTESNEASIQREALAAAEQAVQQCGGELAASRSELKEALAEQQRSMQQLFSRSVSLDGALEEARNLSKSLTIAESAGGARAQEVHILHDELGEVRGFQQAAERNTHSSADANNEVCEQLSAEQAACRHWQEEVTVLRNKLAAASEAATDQAAQLERVTDEFAAQALQRKQSEALEHRQSETLEHLGRELAEANKQHEKGSRKLKFGPATVEQSDESSDDAAAPDVDMSVLLGRGKSGWRCSELAGRLVVGPEVATIGLGFKNMPPAPLLVNSVHAGSWAEGQGLEAGDEILAIDWRRARELTKTEFVKAMQKRPLCLRFKRSIADADMVSVLRFTGDEDEGETLAEPTKASSGRARLRLRPRQPRTECGLRVIDEDMELASSKGGFTEGGESESDFSDDGLTDLDPDYSRERHSVSYE